MPILNGKYVNPGWQNDGPPSIDAAELNAMSDTLENLDASGIGYTSGNGISIIGQQISAKMSTQSGNSATFGSDGGIYVPNQNQYILPPATSSILGGIKVGEGLSVTGDGTLSVSGGTGFYSELVASGNFNGNTTLNVADIGVQNPIFGRAFISVYVQLSNSGQSASSTMGCTFGGFSIIESLLVSPGSSLESCGALFYNAGRYQAVGGGSLALSFSITSSSGQGSYIIHLVGYGPNINNQ